MRPVAVLRHCSRCEHQRPFCTTNSLSYTRATLSLGGKQMVLALLEPARATFQLLRAEPLPSSPQPPRQGNNDAFQKLGIHLPEETELRLAVLCSPSAGESGATKTVEIRKLEQW